MIEGGDGALEEEKRLFQCSIITVQAVSVDNFINSVLTNPFGGDFNCPVKSSTKYKPTSWVRTALWPYKPR